MHVYGELNGTLTSTGRLQGTLVGDHHKISGSLTIPNAVDTELYPGPYVFTPTEDTQTVEIKDYKASENITLNPIPSNYGLITWNGTTLTVS